MAIRTSQERIPFRMHPRVFAALGADLVTNDVVAVIELVKNSYDAMATRVDVIYGSDPKSGPFLEISDNGLGMSRLVLETARFVVATPYRATHAVETRGKMTRRTSGEKGLGRLSAATRKAIANVYQGSRRNLLVGRGGLVGPGSAECA